MAEGAQIETRPKRGWCFDLFCLCFVPDPPYVPLSNQSCLPFDFDLVPFPLLSFSILFSFSPRLSIFFNRPSLTDALVHQHGQNASLIPVTGKFSWKNHVQSLSGRTLDGNEYARIFSFIISLGHSTGQKFEIGSSIWYRVICERKGTEDIIRFFGCFVINRMSLAGSCWLCILFFWVTIFHWFSFYWIRNYY